MDGQRRQGGAGTGVPGGDKADEEVVGGRGAEQGQRNQPQFAEVSRGPRPEVPQHGECFRPPGLGQGKHCRALQLATAGVQILCHQGQRFRKGQQQKRGKTLADHFGQPVAGPHLVTQEGNGGRGPGGAESAGRTGAGRVVGVEQQLGQEQHDARMGDPGQAERAMGPQRPGRILAAQLAETRVLVMAQAAQEYVRLGVFEAVKCLHDSNLGPALLIALLRLDHQPLERSEEITGQRGDG